MEKKPGSGRRVSAMAYMDDVKFGKRAFSKAVDAVGEVGAGDHDAEPICERLEQAVSEETEEQAESASSSEEGSHGKSKRAGPGVVDENEGDQVIHEGTEVVGPDGYLAPSLLG